MSTDKTHTRDEFFAALNARLDAGAVAYGDKSFDRPVTQLLGELKLEALDLAGWGFVLWVRLRKLEEMAQAAE